MLGYSSSWNSDRQLFWLESEKVELIGVTGNIAPQTHFAASPESFSASDVLIIVTYEVSHEQ